MPEPKTKPERRVAGKSKFRLPERPPRVSDVNPLREILQEAKAQEDALAAPVTQAVAIPVKKVSGVARPAESSPPAMVRAGVVGHTAVLPPARPSPGHSASPSFGDFSKRWSPILRSGQMSVCRVLFEMTYGMGEPECFTSMPKLAAAAGIKERQCYNVVAQLEQLGFVERPEIFNTPTKKGTVFRLFLSPQERPAEPNRRYHIGEGE